MAFRCDLYDLNWILKHSNQHFSFLAWGTNNSQRIDLHYNTVDMDRAGRIDCLDMLPYYQRSHARWNTDPFDIHPGTGGNSASDPGTHCFDLFFFFCIVFFSKIDDSLSVRLFIVRCLHIRLLDSKMVGIRFEKTVSRFLEAIDYSEDNSNFSLFIEFQR
jgi:hypothetical protein